MHDTFLLKRISESLGKLRNEKKLDRITKVKIITNPDSHITRENLLEQLIQELDTAVGDWTEIIIERQDIDNLTAVIKSIEGEVFEQQ